jgi:O-antigen ligase
MITKQSFKNITIRKIIWLLIVWQAISVALMAVGTWPDYIALANLGLLALFIVIAKPYYSVLLLTLSIPFSVIFPNPYFNALPMWRPLLVLRFVVLAVRLLIIQIQNFRKKLAIRRWYEESLVAGDNFWGVIWNAILRIDSRFMPWDKCAGLFVVLALFSLLIARFPIIGLKQIIFLVNIYLFYLVIINVVTDEEKVGELMRYALYSLAITVALGFVQFLSTLFASPYYFWQYWAIMVSSLYYGQPLADVLAYSNSWFSGGAGGSLRMFGIMPDTHSFGVMVVFLLAFLLSISVVPQRWQLGFKEYVKAQPWYVIGGLVLAAFAVMASGTRGVWVGLLAPLVVAVGAYVGKIARPLLKVTLMTYVLIILLFAASPLITQGLNYIRTYDADDDTLGRISSIYDLSESSNAGRLEIWKNSVKFAALHPFGVGFGNFVTSLVDDIPETATYEQVANQENLRYNLPQKFITAHSLYLHLLVELGFAGLLAFILFLWEYGESLWKFLGQYSDEYNKYTLLVVGIALALVWVLAYGAFDVTLFNEKVLQYLFISLALSGLIFVKYKSFNRPQ